MNTNEQYTTIIQLIDDYITVWNTIDNDKKRKILARIWSPQGQYIDPRANLIGSNELLNHISNIQSGRPGTTIARTSEIDIHHNLARFHWHLIAADQTIMLEGIDVVYFDLDSQTIIKIIGFFGHLSPL